MSYSFKKLWKLLIDKNIKKKDLASKCDISLSTITRMQNDENISIVTLDKICQELECSLDDIVEITYE